MSLDRIHDVPGLMDLNPQPGFNSTGTASTIASNQFQGGVALGAGAGVMAGSNSTNGGGLYVPYLPKGSATSDFQSFATTGMITHDNCGLVNISVSTTGIALNIQAPTYNGQMLTLAIQPGTTASIVSTLATTGIGGTTTAACQVLRAAITFASTTCVILQAQQLGQTATTNLPLVWSRIL